MRARERRILEEILPKIEYGVLQAEMTFDPLIRDGHAGGRAEHKRMVKAGIAGTPSLLTVWLREARDAVRLLLESKP